MEGERNMYQEHSQLFNTQGNDKLWKYMSLSKFINLLNGRLYFNRVDCFEDVFECTYPTYNAEHRDDIYDTHIGIETFDMIANIARKSTYVSCFHKNDYESAFMWKQYAGDEGVAIITTVDRLKESFRIEKNTIYICDVQYIDYSKEFLPERNIFHLSLYKRKSFIHENEVRCIFGDDTANPKYKGEKGILMNVDLKELIEKVYISPYAPRYMKEDVKNILLDKGLDIEVIYSPLYTIN